MKLRQRGERGEKRTGGLVGRDAGEQGKGREGDMEARERDRWAEAVWILG